MSLPRYAARRDTVEAAVTAALVRSGAKVFRLSAPGLPDLLVGHRHAWHLFEVKTGKATLSPAQDVFRRCCQSHELPFSIIRSPEEALRCLKIMKQ